MYNWRYTLFYTQQDEEPADDIKVEDIHNANETDEDEKENRPKKEKINIPKTLQVSLWDFSGHSHYLQSHTFFIHDPALVIMGKLINIIANFNVLKA